MYDSAMERSVLSAIIFNDEARLQIIYELDAVDFGNPDHAIIFSSMKELIKKEIVPTVENLLFSLKTANQTRAFTLVPELYDEFMPPSFVEECLQKIKKNSFYRKIAAQCQSGVNILNNINAATDVNLENWSNGIRTLFCNQSQNQQSVNLSDILKNAYTNPDRSFIQDIQNRQEQFKNKQEIFSGYPTHFADLDKFFDGFQKGHFTIIGARPGVGKTSFMLNLAMRQAFDNKNKVGIFSLEMPSLSIAEKLVFVRSRIDYKAAKKGNILGTQFQSLYEAVREFEDKTVLVDDTAKINIYSLSNRIKHWIDTHNLNIVFIDYLQLISSGDRAKSKYEQITEISQQLKIIAKECNIPVVCLAQLNRNAVANKDSKPKISDLRDSGSLEQDADEILLLDCPSLDDPYNKPGILVVNVGKNRFGQTGEFQLFFEKNTGFMGDYNPLTRNEEEVVHDTFKRWKD